MGIVSRRAFAATLERSLQGPAAVVCLSTSCNPQASAKQIPAEGADCVLLNGSFTIIQTSCGPFSMQYAAAQGRHSTAATSLPTASPHSR